MIKTTGKATELMLPLPLACWTNGEGNYQDVHGCNTPVTKQLKMLPRSRLTENGINLSFWDANEDGVFRT